MEQSLAFSNSLHTIISRLESEKAELEKKLAEDSREIVELKALMRLAELEIDKAAANLNNVSTKLFNAQ